MPTITPAEAAARKVRRLAAEQKRQVELKMLEDDMAAALSAKDLTTYLALKSIFNVLSKSKLKY